MCLHGVKCDISEIFVGLKTGPKYSKRALEGMHLITDISIFKNIYVPTLASSSDIEILPEEKLTGQLISILGGQTKGTERDFFWTSWKCFPLFWANNDNYTIPSRARMWWLSIFLFLRMVCQNTQTKWTKRNGEPSDQVYYSCTRYSAIHYLMMQHLLNYCIDKHCTWYLIISGDTLFIEEVTTKYIDN